MTPNHSSSNLLSRSSSKALLAIAGDGAGGSATGRLGGELVSGALHSSGESSSSGRGDEEAGLVDGKPAALPLASSTTHSPPDDLWHILRCFFFLGFRAFGSTQGHIQLLQAELVHCRPWLEEGQFNELLALSKSLPGPTSVQMVAAMGSMWLGGIRGALVAGFLFLWPGFLLTYLCALFLRRTSEADPRSFSAQWFTEMGPRVPLEPYSAAVSEATVGFPPAAAAYILYQSLHATRSVCVDEVLSLVAFASALATIFLPPKYARWGFPGLLIAGGAFTLFEASVNPKGSTARYPVPSFRRPKGRDARKEGEGKVPILGNTGISKEGSRLVLLAWLVGLLVLIGIRLLKEPNPASTIFNLFFRIGSMGFGGDYIILANIQGEMGTLGTFPATILCLGLAAVHMLPGHVYMLTVFLGSYFLEIGGGALAGLGVVLPALCLILGSVNSWEYLRQERLLVALLTGLKTAATGVELGLAAVLCIQVVTTRGPLCVALLTVALVAYFKVPLPLATALGALLGWLLLQLNVGGPYCWIHSYTFRYPQFEQMCLGWYNSQEEIAPIIHLRT